MIASIEDPSTNAVATPRGQDGTTQNDSAGARADSSALPAGCSDARPVEGSSVGVRLFAKIKHSSEYRHQHNGKVPFPVELHEHAFDPYIFLGNDNRYRLADLRFYVKVGTRFVALS